MGRTGCSSMRPRAPLCGRRRSDYLASTGRDNPETLVELDRALRDRRPGVTVAAFMSLLLKCATILFATTPPP